MLKRLVVLMVLMCGSTAAWADAEADCHNPENIDLHRRIRGCTQYIRQNPSDKTKLAVPYYSLSRGYPGTRENYGTRGEYRQAIEINPRAARANTNRGITYGEKGDNDRAIADYSEAIEIKPKLAEAYTNRGIAYSDKGD